MNCIDFYKNYFGITKPFEHQEKLWNLINETQFPILMRAPTGSGKTEAVVAPFLQQFVIQEFRIASRLIYVLPMRVLVNSIAERISNYAKKVNSKLTVEIQHGDLPDAPFFLSDVVVTTLDQFIYGFARSSHQIGDHLDIPAGSIASSLVVFDEAHMYRDSYTFSILRAIMEILNKSKIPFVLMTATMPKSLEESLFEYIDIPESQMIDSDLNVGSKARIFLQDHPIYENQEVQISDDLLKMIQKKKTLIVVNQVKRAQEIFQEIKLRLNLGEGEIALLHSRFTRKDREIHEKEALDIIPHKKNGELICQSKPGIVVSTQVLEAGIDFSAELLITELAPADALIQRAGRCARYPEETGEIWVFPTEADQGYKPYLKDHVERTFKWLKANPDFDIKNYSQVCNFVNILDYKANDFEARDSLIDLYECVLYADSKPENIQVRKSKPIYLAVIDQSLGSGKELAEQIKSAIKRMNLRDKIIQVDQGVGWKLKNDKAIQIQLDFDYENNEWKINTANDIIPFRYYLINQTDYDPILGVKPDGGYFI